MSPSNEARMGGHEAPPRILSIFLGERLMKIFSNILEGHSLDSSEGLIVDLGIYELPQITIDDHDRNRTSPFAFTGDKFEFRAVGSSMNVSFPVSILNAAVSDTINHYIPVFESALETEPNKQMATIKFIKSF